MKRLALVLIVAALAYTPPASAACQPVPLRPNNGQSYQVGSWRNAPSPYRFDHVYATVLEYDPWSVPNSNAYAYIGLFGGSSYGIVGWRSFYNSGLGFRQRVSFREYVHGQQFDHDEPFSSAPNTVTIYEVKHDSSYRMSFWAHGQSMWPVSQLTFDGVQGRMYSSINTFSNQMPGASANIMTFSNAHVGYNAAHYPFAGSPSNPNYSLWGLTIPSTTVMGTWEKACTV